MVKHGFSLVVHDLAPAKVEPLREEGATVGPPRRNTPVLDPAVTLSEHIEES